ncbi:MAG: T9SS type A sorting domain-containing protein, partial [Bacteroidota bacterium]
LYDVVGAEGFGMDIEYKVTAEDQLIIKQARPWVSFWADIKADYDLGVVRLVEPTDAANLGTEELVTVEIANAGLNNRQDFAVELWIENELVETMTVTDTLQRLTEDTYQFSTPVNLSAIGDYNLTVVVVDELDGYDRNDTLQTVVRHLHELESSITTAVNNVGCGQEVNLLATITNHGETTLEEVLIGVVVNGLLVETLSREVDIPYQEQEEVAITVTDNLQATDNEITLNLLTVNAQTDAVTENNSSTIATSLESNYDLISLVILTDDYPEENSWKLFDVFTNELVATSFLTSSQEDQVLTEEICVDYGSCYNFQFFDSFGDGICCQYGEGDFRILNSAGEELAVNDGNFGNFAEELFCPNGAGCAINANISTTGTSGENTDDGTLTILPSTGVAPFQFSIDGGVTFFASGLFDNLSSGTYSVVINGAIEGCTYEEEITVEVGMPNSVAELAAGTLKLFPNPTREQVIIQPVNGNINVGPLNMGIYNALGTLVRQVQGVDVGATAGAVVSLRELAAGTYVIRLFNAEVEQRFKVVKL